MPSLFAGFMGLHHVDVEWAGKPVLIGIKVVLEKACKEGFALWAPFQEASKPFQGLFCFLVMIQL